MAKLPINWWSDPVTGYSKNAWNCSDWITWHKKLKKRYGTKWAKVIWVDYWNREQRKLFTRNELICPFNSEFLTYIAQNDLDINNVLEDVARGSGYLVDAAGNLFNSAGQLIFSTSQAVNIGSRLIGTAVKLLPLGLAAGAVYLASNQEARKKVIQYARGK